jgi:hypothetical protein
MGWTSASLVEHGMRQLDLDLGAEGGSIREVRETNARRALEEAQTEAQGFFEAGGWCSDSQAEAVQTGTDNEIELAQQPSLSKGLRSSGT